MTKTNFLKTADIFSPTNEQQIKIYNDLPIGTYSLSPSITPLKENE